MSFYPSRNSLSHGYLQLQHTHLLLKCCCKIMTGSEGFKNMLLIIKISLILAYFMSPKFSKSCCDTLSIFTMREANKTLPSCTVLVQFVRNPKLECLTMKALIYTRSVSIRRLLRGRIEKICRQLINCLYCFSTVGAFFSAYLVWRG